MSPQPMNDITKQAIWKLAHFEPSAVDSYGNQAIDYLMLDGLATYGPLLPVTPAQIQDHIKKVFLLDFEHAEIISAARRMEAKGYISINAHKDKSNLPSFSINAELSEKISRNLSSTKEEEQTVLDEWKDKLIETYKSHPAVEQNIGIIVNGLQSFLSAIMIRHGVECVNLLYPDNAKATKWLDSIKEEALDLIPKTDGFIDTITRLEVPKFFLEPDEQRKRYIFRVFNSSFLWHLIQVDENCSNLFREVTSGQRLYLDNNVIYSLVGFHGAYTLKSTHNMLKLANELGYDLYITTKTVDEFHESLQWRMKQYKSKPPIPAELAMVAVKNLDVGSFITAYWKELAETGITIEEFVSEKSHLEKIFSGLDIRISGEYREEIEKSKDIDAEINTLRQIVPWASEFVLNHDAYHRVLIQKVRTENKYNFKDATAWFLTADSKLPVYDRVARKGNNCLPFCLTTDHWIQINRPLITRTSNQDEYEKSFYTLVTQPFLRSVMPQVTLEKAHQEVLSRLARYKEMNPQLAFDIVSNKHFMLAIASEDEPEKIDEKLEHEFLDVAVEYQQKAETLSVNNANLQIELREQIELLHNQVSERNKTLTSTQKEKEKLEREKDKLEKDKQRLERENITIRNRIKWVIFVVLLTLASYSIWFLNILEEWFSPGKGIIIAKLLEQLIAISILLLIPLWKFRKWLLGTALFGLIGTVLNLLPDILKD